MSTKSLCLRFVAGPFLAAALTITAPAEVIYVSQAATGAGNNGQSWTTAYRNLTPALAQAEAGDEVRIGDGTYVPDVGTLVADGVTIRGGYAGFGAANPDLLDPAQFTCYIDGNDIRDTALTVAPISLGVSISGVTLRRTDGEGALVVQGSDDAGLLLLDQVRFLNSARACLVQAANVTLISCLFSGNGDDATPGPGLRYVPAAGSNRALVLRDCRFLDNRCTTMFDGALEVADVTGPRPTLTVEDCTFRRTETGFAALARGDFVRCVFSDNPVGGVSGSRDYQTEPPGPASTFTDCTFSGNGVGIFGGRNRVTGSSFEDNDVWGGIFWAYLVDARSCVFRNNTSNNAGAAIHIKSSTVPGNKVVDCHFALNRADGRGGAIYTGNPLLVQNATFLGNRCGNWIVGYFGGGGAIYAADPLECTNAVFVGNRTPLDDATQSGGAVYALDDLTLTNCTVVGNTSGGATGGVSGFASSAVVSNSILWGNSGYGTLEQQQVSIGAGQVRYCCIEGLDQIPGIGNTGHPPGMVDPDGPDNELGTEDDDVRLLFGSPALDAGDLAALPADSEDLDGDGDTDEPLPLDAHGNPRDLDDPNTPDTGPVPDGRPDLGALEGPTTGLRVDPTWICPEGRITTFSIRTAGRPSAPGGLTIRQRSGDPDIRILDTAIAPDTPARVRVWVEPDPDWSNGSAIFDLHAPNGWQATIEVREADRDPVPRRVFVRPGGTGHGNSWTDAFGELHAPLAAAATRPEVEEVWIASGTYTPTSGTSRTASFRLLRGMRLHGGFAGSETSLAQRDPNQPPTILSGDLAGDDGPATNRSDNSFTVVSDTPASKDVLLENLLIRGGNANRGSLNSTRSSGAGLILAGTGQLLNCRIIDNKANAYAGGILVNGYDLTNCVIAYNTADLTGGLSAHPTSVLRNCLITNNASTLPFGPGGLHAKDALVLNTILWGNSSGSPPPDSQVSDARLRNCLVHGLPAAPDADGNFGANPLFFDPAGPDGIEGTVDDDWRLPADSPAVDAGNAAHLPADVFDLDSDGNIEEPLPVDLRGRPRVTDVLEAPDVGCGIAGVVDIGPIERTGIIRLPCAGDADGDGLTGLGDLALLLAAYGADGPGASNWDCRADRNQDDQVNISDLAIVLSEFGQKCP